MTRRCSHCSNNGHNARTCPTRSSGGGGSVRLFGVSLTEGVGAVGSIKKSASMSCLASSSSGASGAASAGGGTGSGDRRRESGYLSDDAVHGSCSSTNCRTERKKGTPWTEQEHKMFLIGLQKLGKGDWRGISRNYVISRTPTQVASHAQKYFLRQINVSRRKRRTSLFDMVTDVPSNPAPPAGGELHEVPHLSQPQEPNQITPLFENIHPDHSRAGCQQFTSTPPIPPTLYPHVASPNFNPVWYGSTNEFVKPVALQVDEVASMSKLQISDAVGPKEQVSLSLKLFEPTNSRPSDFHPSPSISLPDLNKNSGSVIHAV